MKDLNVICDMFKLGKLVTYEKMPGSQNIVYKVTTDKSSYIIKKYHKDAIKNYYHLNKRKKQIKISEKLNKKGINCILPIKRKRKNFFKYDSHYYLVYPYCDGIYKTAEEFTSDNIINLAKMQAKIHQTRLNDELPCTYKYIYIDLNYVLKKYKNNNLLCELIKNDKDKLISLIEKCNQNINIVKNNLCISHNDYKPLNILWNNDKPILLDFDASGKVNPTCALCESAFALSRINGKLDLKRYELYLKNYLRDFGKLKDDFSVALTVCMNGKLCWLKYLIDTNREKDMYYMLKELILFCNNISIMEDIYERLV